MRGSILSAWRRCSVSHSTVTIAEMRDYSFALHNRGYRMKVSWPSRLAAAVLVVLSGTTTASADVLTFDTIVAPNNFTINDLVIDDFSLTGASNTTLTAGVFDTTVRTDIWGGTAVSGENVMTNWNSRTGEITSSTSFDFEGAYFHQDIRNGPTLVNFFGLNDVGTVLYSTSFVVGDTWQFVTFDWAGISAFRWDPVSPTVSNVGIDDFTYSVARVPEPTILVLFGLGIGMMAATRRRVSRGPSPGQTNNAS